MKQSSHKTKNKIIILFGAIFIGAFSTIYTNHLVEELKEEEQNKVELWAQAIRLLVQSDNSDHSLPLILEVIKNNTTVPVLIADADGTINHYRNLNVPEKNTEQYLQQKLKELKDDGEQIEIDLGDGDMQYLYYKTSTLLIKLTWFPIIQLLIISIFVFIAYLAFSNSRKAEQNQIWVGMAKETAHQLGTPITSLMGWTDFLGLKSTNQEILDEIKKDVNRLQNIADRFSKIGSKPILQETELDEVVKNSIEYLRNRSSNKVEFNIDLSENTLVKVNITLIEWVFENLIKNAIDAIKGDGIISVSTHKLDAAVAIDVSDNGKGISRHRFKTVFEPGYTTKERGWGLGLSLTKRIVEEYHKGKIFVKESEPYKKTTFRIILQNT
jgi:signal transduction histidine kinase